VQEGLISKTKKAFNESIKRFRKCMRKEQCSREEWRNVARDASIAALALVAVVTVGKHVEKVFAPKQPQPVSEKTNMQKLLEKEFPVGRLLYKIGDDAEDEFYVKGIGAYAEGDSIVYKILYGLLSDTEPSSWTSVDPEAARKARENIPQLGE
jgi:hypothetical protein